MWRSAARSIGTCLALLCFFAVSSADPSPPSRADVTSGVRVAQRLIDTIPSPWRLDGDVRMAGDDAPVAQGNFVQASYALNKASLDSVATFSRASNAMQFDISGYLTYGPNNLLTYSNTFSNAAWTKATMTVAAGFTDPFGGSNATRLTATGATSYVVQSTTGSSGFNALTSIWVRRVSGSGAINLWTIAGSTGTAITPTSTWTQYSVTGNAPTGVAYAGIIIQTSGDVIEVYAPTASAVTYETTPRPGDQVITTTSAAYYGPRFDYTYNGSSWVPAGLLVEGAATNQHKYSGALATTLTASNITTVANAGTALDGGNNLTKLIEVASTSTHFVYDTTLAGAIISATTTTISYYVKAGTRQFVGLNLQGAANNYASVVFNLSNGTASQTSTGGTSGTINASGIESKGGGVYRIWMAATVTGSSTPCLFLTNAATGNVFTSVGLVSYTATGEDFFVWGGQVESGSYASSYTPTGASAVTRAAETVQFTGPALTALQGAAHSIIIQTTDVGIMNGNSLMGAGNDYQQNINSGTVFNSRGAAGPLTVTLPSGTFASPQRVGYATDGSTRTAVASGVKSTGSGGYTPVGAVNLGSYSAGSWAINAHIASLAVWNSRLPDAALQSKSVVGASYAANDNGIRYAFADNDNLPVHWRVAL